MHYSTISISLAALLGLGATNVANAAAVPVTNSANLAAAAGTVSTDLPLPLQQLQVAAHSLAFTYCSVTIGDQENGLTLLDVYDDDSVPYSRINFYYSKDLDGVVVAFTGYDRDSIAYNLGLSNLDVFKTSADPLTSLSSDAKVDVKWNSAFKKLWPTVLSKFDAIHKKYQDKRVYIAGHNAGAGHGALLTLALRQHYSDIFDSVVFLGGPRVGDATYAKEFDSYFHGAYTNVQNGNDWVPNVPTTNDGYHHASGLIHINPSDSTNYTYYSEGDDPTWLKEYPGVFHTGIDQWGPGGQGTVNVNDDFGTYFGVKFFC